MSRSVLSPRKLSAIDILTDVAEIYSISAEYVRNTHGTIRTSPTLGDDPTFTFVEEKTSASTTNVSYVQTVLGLPIWDAEFYVTILSDPLRVVSSTSTIVQNVQIIALTDAKYADSITLDTLKALLTLEGWAPVINSSRFLVHRYDPTNRLLLGLGNSTFPLLLDVSDGFTAGTYYVVQEVLFQLLKFSQFY